MSMTELYSHGLPLEKTFVFACRRHITSGFNAAVSMYVAS